MPGQHGHNTRLHAQLSPICLDMEACTTSQLNVSLISNYISNYVLGLNDPLTCYPWVFVQPCTGRPPVNKITKQYKTENFRNIEHLILVQNVRTLFYWIYFQVWEMKQSTFWMSLWWASSSMTWRKHYHIAHEIARWLNQEVSGWLDVKVSEICFIMYSTASKTHFSLHSKRLQMQMVDEYFGWPFAVRLCKTGE